MIRLKHRSIIVCQRTIETGRRNGHPPRDDRHWHRNCRSLLYQLYQYCINILLCGIDVWRKMSVILMILTLSFWRYLPTILFCLVYNIFGIERLERKDQPHPYLSLTKLFKIFTDYSQYVKKKTREIALVNLTPSWPTQYQYWSSNHSFWVSQKCLFLLTILQH